MRIDQRQDQITNFADVFGEAVSAAFNYETVVECANLGTDKGEKECNEAFEERQKKVGALLEALEEIAGFEMVLTRKSVV